VLICLEKQTMLIAQPSYPVPVARSKFPQLFLKFGAVLIVLGFAVLAGGAGPLARPLSPEQITDDKLAVRIQAALANDPELKKMHLNLLVNVVDRAAVIGGAVPSLNVVDRVERVVRAVPGISDVKVSAWVPAAHQANDPFAQMVAREMRTGTEPQRKATEPQLNESFPMPAMSLPNPDLPAAEKRDRTTIAVPTAQSHSAAPIVVHRQPGSLLLEPVAPGTNSTSSEMQRPPGAAPLPYKTIPPTSVPTVPESTNGLPDSGWSATIPAIAPQSNELVKQIEQLRRSDVEYAQLKVELREAVAIITGEVKRDTTPWEFAHELRKLPRIQRVILGTITTR